MTLYPGRVRCFSILLYRVRNSRIPEAKESTLNTPKHKIQFGQKFVSVTKHLENTLDMSSTVNSMNSIYRKIYPQTLQYSAAQPNVCIHRLKGSKVTTQPSLLLSEYSQTSTALRFGFDFSFVRSLNATMRHPWYCCLNTAQCLEWKACVCLAFPWSGWPKVTETQPNAWVSLRKQEPSDVSGASSLQL